MRPLAASTVAMLTALALLGHIAPVTHAPLIEASPQLRSADAPTSVAALEPPPGVDEAPSVAAATIDDAVAAAPTTSTVATAPADPAPTRADVDAPRGRALPGTDVAAVNNPAIAAGERMDPQGPAGFKAWEVGGFVDVNYAYNSNNPASHVNRGTSVQPRTGEFTLNHVVAFLRRDPIPGRFSPLFELAVQAGPAADALVAAEPNPGGADGKYAGPEVWKHLARANLGLRTRRGFEAVAGMHLSPVGIGVHWSPYNWNYTVTWQLNSVPYYLAGLKLAQTIRDAHQLQLWVVNGWQILADNNRAPSVMLGYVYTPSDRFTFGEYLWIGPEQPDMRPAAWRLFSDTQFTYNTERFGVGGLFDVGVDPRTDLPGAPKQMWMTGAVFSRWRVLGEHRTWDMALRPELFWDRDGRIYGVPQAMMSGAFTNSFRVFESLLLRVEYRYDWSSSPDGFFYRGDAIADDAVGLGRQQHTIFFSVAGVFAHRFTGKRP